MFGGAQAMYAKMKAKKEAEAAAAAAAAGGGAAAASSSSSSSAPAAAAAPGPPKLDLERPSVTPPKKGVLVIFGATNHPEEGKKSGNETDCAEMPNLFSPHRLCAGLGNTRIAFVASGCTSAHCVALGVDGEAFAWGRNDFGQLGTGDHSHRTTPTPVLKGTAITKAATGKAHTVFLTREGELMACGATKQGAVGPNGPVKGKAESAPKPVSVPVVNTTFVAVASGTSFNLAIDTNGDVWSWGWSEHGVLGNGDDGEHNTKEGAVKLSYSAESKPARVTALLGLKNIDVACGAQHCAAISGEGVVYTWGNGGYGRLGHKTQESLFTPRPLKNELRAKRVSCGAASTAMFGWPVMANGVVCVGAPALFMCGRVRAASQNAWMYPKPEEELRGWNLHTFALGAAHNIVHADDCVIAWGSGCSCGELGLVRPIDAKPKKIGKHEPEPDKELKELPGSKLTAKKTSAAPAKVDRLNGVSVAQVACGVAHTLLLVESDEVVENLPLFTPSAETGGEESKASAGKRAAEPAPAGKGKKSKA
jgi:alpha-tubulin suppressor-like RCC1 family protein